MFRMGYLRKLVLKLLSAGMSRSVIWLNYNALLDEPAAPISMDNVRILSQKTTLNLEVLHPRCVVE